MIRYKKAVEVYEIHTEDCSRYLLVLVLHQSSTAVKVALSLSLSIIKTKEEKKNAKIKEEK